MRSRLQSSLPVDELWRIGEQVLDDQQAPLMALQDVIECGLIEVRQGQCVFRHELLQRYFEAMALARGSTTLLDLTESLRKPANHALIEFVLEMQCGAAGVRACLQAAAVAPSMSRLFAACLQGRFGEIARTVVIRDAGQLLRQAESDLLLIQIDVKRDESITEVEIRGGKEWTAYEHAVMNALSDSLPAGLFLEEVLHLIAETEHRCINLLETSLGAEKVNRRSFRSNLFWRLFVIGQASRSLPAAAILRAIDGRVTPDVLPSVIERVQNHLGQIDGLSYAQIYLLLTIMRYHAMPKEEDIPQIIRHCWNTGIYHLQLKLLDCVGIWGGRQGDDDSMSGPTRSCVADILSGLHTQNVFLRTLLFETMMVYNLIEPPVDPTLLRGELNNILGRPDDPDAQAAAYAAVSNMFEPLVADVYFPAIENFPRTDRTKLFTMAALGSPPYSMCVDFILSELLKENDRSTIPAFQRFTSHLDGESCFPQDVAASFIVGHAGCSRYLDTPPQLADYSTDDYRAWQCYGEIIFWSQKPGLPKDKIIGRCKPLWHTLQNELAFEAVDPLWRLADADGNSPHSGAHEPVQHVFILCRHEIQKILEFGMKHRYRLSSIDKWFSAFALARYLTTFMIHTLGQIGDAHTTSLLFPLVNDDYHGPDAVDAIRCINSGHQTKRITVLRRCP